MGSSRPESGILSDRQDADGADAARVEDASTDRRASAERVRPDPPPGLEFEIDASADEVALPEKPRRADVAAPRTSARRSATAEGQRPKTERVAPARPTSAPTRGAWRSTRDLTLMVGCGALVGLAAVVRPFVTGGANAATPSASALVGMSDLPEGAAPPAWDEEPRTNDAPLSGCAIPDMGMGPYVEVPSASPFLAKVYVPKERIGQSDAYHLLVHFHGGEPVRKLMVLEDFDYVIATIDRGNGSSAYLGSVKDRKAWDELIAGIDEHVSRAMGRNMKTDDVLVSSWSAGYKAVEELLRLAPQPPELHGLVLLDSLHASKPIGKGQLDGFIRAGKRATKDPAFFFTMVHSAIIPEGYASTTDTANYVLTRVGAHRQEVTDGGQDRLPLRTVAQKGRFEVRGYAGNDKAAHCDQLRLLSIILHRQKKATTATASTATTPAPATSAVAGASPSPRP